MTKSFLILIIVFLVSSKTTIAQTQPPSLNSFFIDLPDSVFNTNILPYGMDFRKQAREKLLIDGVQFPDSIINRKNGKQFYFNEQYPAVIDLAILGSEKPYYSLIISEHGELGIHSTLYIFTYKKGSLVECSKQILPEITLSDFIHQQHLDKFTPEFIASPTLSYTYKGGTTDTLQVAFEIIDHPFFYTDHPDFTIEKSEYALKEGDPVIKHEVILLVWKKRKFIKVK